MSDIPPENPESLEEWLWRVVYYKDAIYVRHQLPDGKWANVALADLDPKEQAHYMALWIKRGQSPVRVVRAQKEG